MTPKQEARLINRAVRNRWDIPAEEMQKTIERVVYLRDNADDEAVQMAAVRAIVSMVGQNQKDEHKVIDVRVVTRNDQYDAIAAELGIAPDLIEHAARQADILAGRTEENATARTGER
jgi:cell division protein FtsX